MDNDEDWYSECSLCFLLYKCKLQKPNFIWPRWNYGLEIFYVIVLIVLHLYIQGKNSSDEEDLNDVPDDDEYDTEDSFIDDTELVSKATFFILYLQYCLITFDIGSNISLPSFFSSGWVFPGW